MLLNTPYINQGLISYTVLRLSQLSFIPNYRISV